MYGIEVSKHRLIFVTALASFSIAASLARAAPEAVPPDALSPRQALDSFALAPGLRVELVAAEPLVDSPVAIAFDQQGYLYVAENRGYPSGPAPGEPPMGRIARLADTDGDGRYDRRTDFATDLTFPNGVLPWRGGLIVTCAPDILYLKDTDGDGQADERTVWFTGFATTGSTQLRVSHPTLGLDNWVYVTSGLTGGSVTCPAHPERPALKFGRTDFRFRPDLSAYETCDGGGQYGLCFDDAGHRFICYNRVQVQHVVLSSRYLQRNPHLAFSETVENCPTDLAPEPLAGHGQGARLFPISANITTADSHAGTFTAACGVFVWRGGNLPEQYTGGAFSCDPTGNLVHFDQLKPHGATFTAEPILPGREFLASRDNWFRPVFLGSGPDEALYICDMYRKTIEHPDYLPAEIRKRTDFDSGRGMGRIWRVVRADRAPDDLAARRKQVAQWARDPSTAVELLKSDGAWARDLGHRLLLERPVEKQSPLAPLLADAAMPATAKTHLLALLDACGEVTDAILARCLADENAAVRERALVLAEPRLGRSGMLADAALRLADDADPRVRFQAALSLGFFPGPEPIPALARLAVHDALDRWLRAAVLSSISGREPLFLGELLRLPERADTGLSALHASLGRLLGAGLEPAAAPALLIQVLDSDESVTRRAALLSGIAEALSRRGADQRRLFGQLLTGDSPEMVRGRKRLSDLFTASLARAGDTTVDASQRTIAINLLAHAGFDTAGPPLLALVHPQQPDEIQTAAIRALAGMQDASISRELLAPDRFAEYSPAVREEVLAAMLASDRHIPGLLEAMEGGAFPVGAINSLRRKQLTEHRDAAIRARAERIFGVGASSDRGRVYEEYKSVVGLTPRPDNGQAMFRKHCATCHRLDREGFAVGPDLFGVRNQSKETILLHLLIPEHEITSGFGAYIVETTDGRTLTGLLASETPTSITLRQPLGKEETILRSDVERLLSSKLSLMPQEFEKAMTRQELADLLAYLKGESSIADRQQPAAAQNP
ncbi:MAG TPA: PVC-type heme-binding CxxCH protein [Pirellulales bacterium]|nr:PVC-type heme-binding CxxCH protein [Pirellulales bacterium]